jgi:hypothetical protein
MQMVMDVIGTRKMNCWAAPGKVTVVMAAWAWQTKIAASAQAPA